MEYLVALSSYLRNGLVYGVLAVHDTMDWVYGVQSISRPLLSSTERRVTSKGIQQMLKPPCIAEFDRTWCRHKGPINLPILTLPSRANTGGTQYEVFRGLTIHMWT